MPRFTIPRVAHCDTGAIDGLPRGRRLKATILLTSAELSLATARKQVAGEDIRPASLESVRRHLGDIGDAIRQAERCLWT